MRVDLIVHAPGAASWARAALPWLSGAIFGDEATRLVAAIRALGSQTCTRLAILDAWGQRPNPPLSDIRLGLALREALAPASVVTVTVLSPNTAPELGLGFGGAGTPFESAGPGRSASGFGGGFGGFSGGAFSREPVLPAYSWALRQSLGVDPSFRRVAWISLSSWL